MCGKSQSLPTLHFLASEASSWPFQMLPLQPCAWFKHCTLAIPGLVHLCLLPPETMLVALY